MPRKMTDAHQNDSADQQKWIETLLPKKIFRMLTLIKTSGFVPSLKRHLDKNFLRRLGSFGKDRQIDSHPASFIQRYSASALTLYIYL